MANLYYNAAVDNSWDTLLNWWTDAAFTNPALALPATGDTVYLAAQMDSGPSVSVTLTHIYVADASTGGGAFYVDFTGAIGNATFNDSSYNYYTGTVTGNATFNNGSYNFGTVSGDATFNDNSANLEIVTGNATFNDYSYNNDPVLGDATFNDSSFNQSATVSGNATFNDNSANDSNGTVSGDATFNDNSGNAATVSGNATFNDNSGNFYPATVSGNATFNDSSFNQNTYNNYGYFTFNGPYALGRIAANSTYSDLTVNMTASSGGSGIDIARLLNLPWFINI